MPKNRPINDFNSLFGAPISMKKIKEESNKVKKGEKSNKDRFLVKDDDKLKDKKKKKTKTKEINANKNDKERVKKKLDPKLEPKIEPIKKSSSKGFTEISIKTSNFIFRKEKWKNSKEKVTYKIVAIP